MKNIITMILCLTLAGMAVAQSGDDAKKMKEEMKKYRPQLGIKAGFNFSRPTSAKDFKPENKSGFMVAGFFSPPAHGLIGYRTELVFSRQGFTYDESGKKQDVQQDYIYMPHFTTINIKDVVQFQVGGQIGYLLNAKKVSNSNNNPSGVAALNDYFNRLDYGFAGGMEVYPFKGLIIGGRYNISMGKMYKQSTIQDMTNPFPFNPQELNSKNGVIQFFAGYKF